MSPTIVFASRFYPAFRFSCVAAVLTLLPAAARSDEGETISFNRDIRPLLADKCFSCHGPDPDTREADLRLDTREEATADRGDATAIVPGDVQRSAVIERITASDESLRMPPVDSDKVLSADQIELLRRWIEAGAPYEGHWALQPIRRMALPPVESEVAGWPRTGIDHFILAELERLRIRPSPPAERHTLIRRVYLDLLGLLPPIEEVDRFVDDPRPDAYERLLDRVLASPRFGERWGRHWLDQARYADSHGYTNDNERIMWPYRDWVIDALNRDLPFDQFTVEQLAGDLLDSPTLDQLVATGFHRNTLINTEGGTKADQFRDEQVKDRVNTTGTVWLALTIGCAQCHAHKFDPITQAEYYQFYAFFNSTADNNSIVPSIKAPTRRQREQFEELKQRKSELEQILQDDPQRDVRMTAWEMRLIASAEQAGETVEAASDFTWTGLELSPKSVGGASFEELPDGSLLVSGDNVAEDEYQLTALSPLTTIRSIRLEALTHESLPQTGPGRAGNGNFVLSEIWFRTGDGRELRFSKAYADHAQPDYDVTQAIDGKPNTGWAINGSPEGGPNHDRTAWLVLPQPLEVELGHALTFTLQFQNQDKPYNLGRFRVWASSEVWVEKPSVRQLARVARLPAPKRSQSQQQRLIAAFLTADPDLGPVYDELQQVLKREEELDGQVPSAMVMQRLDTSRQTQIQIRGDFLRPDERVRPGVPAALPQVAPSSRDEADQRLDLARWLVRTDNPLTPRVRVNRIWMRLFGTALVETDNDFGKQGTTPTHPALLDWLASEFVEEGWSTKRILRLLLNSATYRQASHERHDLEKIDPQNRYYARQNRFRVEGEIVRDISLVAAKLLSDKIGGPGVYPPQPAGVYAFTQRDKNWRVSEGEDRYRRGMYTFFYRSAPYPMLTTFDAPKFNQTCTRRDRSNTPLQALTVANDEVMFELTRALAARVLEVAEPHDGARLEHLFGICFSRPPLAGEREILQRFWRAQAERFAADPDAAAKIAPPGLASELSMAEAAAWVATARILVNLDEFITRE